MRWRWLEFAALFVGVPSAIYLHWLPNWPIPALLSIGLTGWLLLRRDPAFDRTQLWNASSLRAALLPVAARALLLALLMGVGVYLFRPGLLFSFVKRTPWFWALVMIFYPVLSVYPQEFLYRALLFHRYRDLFPSEAGIILASAAAFGFVHIIFGAWISVALSFVGGLLFALTYARTKSLLLVCIEHAILGNAIFTVGLGQYFYHGSARFHM